MDRWVVSMCNQTELTPSEFIPEENGGFRLQPRSFGRTLQNWEMYWANARLDQTLDGWLDRLSDVIRRYNPSADEGTDPPEDL